MALDPDALSDDVLTFLSDPHLATLTTQRADGSPHVVAVGFTYDPQTRLARVITWDASQKAVNVARGGTRAVVAQVDGGRWLALEGEAHLATDEESARDLARRAMRELDFPARPRRLGAFVAPGLNCSPLRLAMSAPAGIGP